jgi:putative endonuclease
MEYIVYVLLSKKDKKFYTGFTTNLNERINKHNSGKVISTHYRIPLELVYYEVCYNQKDALHRERYLKSTYVKRYIRIRIKNYLNLIQISISQGKKDMVEEGTNLNLLNS